MVDPTRHSPAYRGWTTPRCWKWCSRSRTAGPPWLRCTLRRRCSRPPGATPPTSHRTRRVPLRPGRSAAHDDRDGFAVGLDYTDAGVPTFDRVRDRIEERFGTAIGSEELERESRTGRDVDEQWQAREKAAATGSTRSADR